MTKADRSFRYEDFGEAGGTTHIPLKVNSAGMISLIFAQSILIFPRTVAGYFLAAENEWKHVIVNDRLEDSVDELARLVATLWESNP